ncbi:MAG: bifunctional diaminohydroxyphosphoribosylaminopyrimidine deaminase/5-amino-6-(5-phosphoribosylamino)uracil reductase RibD [Rubrivivax sp.]
MALTPDDETRLREALALAEQGFGLTDPNPRVGCVIADAQGRVIGRGHTQRAGQAHAEVMALRDLRARGADPRGGTAWVTLEPCAHHGRTPPCCDALIEAGLSRVVVAVQDPFEAVAGRGLQRLRDAGLQVELAGGAIEAAAREINCGFFSRIERGRPWVRLKMAASIDGFTALPDGRSQWITGPQARADGHAWRRRAGAVLTGIGTVLADDPRLDVRHVPSVLQPLRVVVDSHGRTPATARLLAPPGEVLLVHATPVKAGFPAPRLVLPGAGGRVDLQALLPALAARGINELLVEAGPTLAGEWLRTGAVDEVLLYMAPRWFGQGRPLALRPPLDELSAPPAWRFVDATPLGHDLRVRMQPVTSDSFTTQAPPHPRDRA